MAKIKYNGKEYEAKLDNGKLLELEERGWGVLNIAQLSKDRPMRFNVELIRAAIGLSDDVPAGEIANGFDSLDALNSAAAELLKDVFPAVPTQAVAKKRTAKKK